MRSIVIVLSLSLMNFVRTVSADDRPSGLIGFTEHRTNLPGGRQANISTSRAKVMRANGTDCLELASELAQQSDFWTQFAGWSPDGKTAIIGRGWVSVENAKWEEEHKTFRFTKEGCSYDSYLVDVASGKSENVTGVNRVSFYNSGLFFWPANPRKLGFTALINGESHPYSMDRDGHNKVDLIGNSNGFTYGFSSSPDGTRISYHKNYQVYLADADGSHSIHVKTGHPFNFAPVWSPDGTWLLFLSGEHYNCHPCLVRSDGSGLRKLADRGGYRGVIEFLDVPDFHGGSSDTPVWATDGKSVFYTCKIGESVELMQVNLDGKSERMTDSQAGTLHYHPKPSPDGKWIIYGSKRQGVRNLFLMRLSDRTEHQLTKLPVGSAAMHAHWQAGQLTK